MRAAAPPCGRFTLAGIVHTVVGTGTATRLAVPTATDGTTCSIDGRRACPRNQRGPSPSAAMARTESQLKDLSLCTAWATTGEAVAAAVAVAGQNSSLKPAGRALRMLAISRCNMLPRPLMVIPPSRTCLLMKVIATGAAMVSRVEIAPDDSPDSRLIALGTDFSLFPNSAGTMRWPIAIKDELGSVTLPSIWH